MPRIHDDNPDPSARGQRHTPRDLRRAPASGEVVGRASRPGSYDDDDDEGPSAADIERFSRETRDCPECRKEVFDDTAICYHCGHAFERQTAGAPGKAKTWVVATVIVLVVIFVLAAVGGVF